MYWDEGQESFADKIGRGGGGKDDRRGGNSKAGSGGGRGGRRDRSRSPQRRDGRRDDRRDRNDRNDRNDRDYRDRGRNDRRDRSRDSSHIPNYGVPPQGPPVNLMDLLSQSKIAQPATNYPGYSYQQPQQQPQLNANAVSL
jgi:hypothetical protein